MEAEESHHQDSHRTCKRSRGGGGAAAVEEADGATGRSGLRPWNHQSSRIFRVSRASGGKDRHSKVYTSKGLRDRRIRLSVSTAIQFYDLQDRLGCDQPSKAIEWLIKSAASSIAELPTLETSAFPLDPPKLESLHREIEQHCSSPSETSKGSVLYLSQSETRVKARERARERSATKGKDPNESINHTLNSQSSFTELLAGNNGTPIAQANPIQKQQIRYLPVAATADYFSHGGLTSLAHNGNGAPMGIVPINIEHPDLPQFAFIQDHHPMGDYSLNFSSPCLAGFNRGTLQSNSPSPLPHHQHHHIQRLSCPVEGFNLPFFLGSAPVTSAMANSGETQLADAFDGRLQLCFGDGHGVSDLKGKGTS